MWRTLNGFTARTTLVHRWRFNSPCLLIAGKAWAQLWKARALHSTTARSIRTLWTRTSSCQRCWWAGRSQRWACGSGCRSSRPDLRVSWEKGSSCCGSSSTRRWASSSAQPGSFVPVAGLPECSTVCGEPPPMTWSCSLSRRYQCDWWLAGDDWQHPEPAGSSKESLE